MTNSLIELIVGSICILASLLFLLRCLQKRQRINEYNAIMVRTGALSDYSKFWIEEMNRIIEGMDEADSIGDSEEYAKLEEEYAHVEFRFTHDVEIPSEELKQDMRDFQNKWNMSGALFVPIGTQP